MTSISGKGTITNDYGFFSLTLPKENSVKVRVSYVGYVTKVFEDYPVSNLKKILH